MRKTKIVCTIGPASRSEAVLAKLMDAGMNVARLNFSHGSHQEHGETIARIRAVAREKGLPIAVLQDLSGPKIRVGNVAAGTVVLQAGQTFTLTVEDVPGDEQRVSVPFHGFPTAVKKGDRILLADGSIELQVVETRRKEVVCEVVVGGELSSKKGINLPGSSLKIKAFTEKDRKDLEFGLEQGVDYVAMSFVRTQGDVLEVKELMTRRGRSVPVIAKIEKHEALDHIDEIIAVVDGIMVARGDLAVETALERVPVVQKELILKCNRAGKPVITATQMLKSMVDNPRPTRAEANDVANAVLDGTDAVMLSEETTVGRYPVEAVRTMARIIEATESSDMASWHAFQPAFDTPATIQQAVSRGAFEIAKDVAAAAILTPTHSGSTARMVSAFRPGQPIVALSPKENVVRGLNLIWGVYPLLTREYDNALDMEKQIRQAALKSGLVQKGARVVITAGIPVGKAGTTNLIKVEIL